MQRQSRLTESAEIQRVRQQGRSTSHPLLVLYARRAPDQPTRVGFSVGKRVGGTVVRNRARRRIREALRLRWAELAPGWELLVVVRAGAATAPYARLAEALEQVLRRAGVLAAPPAPARAPERGASG